MQLSARILTALAVLAFVVGVVVGTRGATDEVSAATGTIDALNVGACATNNADVFEIDNCSQRTAFYQQGELDDLIEVDTLYATYAHDPRTGAENPRAILKDSDLIRVSITDKGRDRRDPVLITTAEVLTVTPPDNNGFYTDDGTIKLTNRVDAAGPPAVSGLNAAGIIAGSVFGDVEKTEGLPDLEQTIMFDGEDDGDTTFGSSGSYQVLFENGSDDEHYKPIAPKGVVKFFGRVSENDEDFDDDDEEFKDIGDWIKIDEDVISGETNIAPAIKLNVSVPRTGAVQLQLIYYETSGIEYIQGGIRCVDAPEKADPDDERKFDQAECTAKEREPAGDEDNALFELYAESDEDAGGDGTDRSHRKNLALIETGRFTGVFQGFLRLTDADGKGGEARDNWGLEKTSGALLADLEDGEITADELAAAQAVLGVGNGPVTIRYKDSDDKNKVFDIQLDIEPPTIQIDSPVHKDRSDDEKPSFIGTFNDADSGLAARSFQLNIDNRDPDPGPVMGIMSGVKGTGSGMDGQVLRRLDYKGYSDDGPEQFGVIEDKTLIEEIYKPDEDVAATEAKEFKSVDADDFDDGDPDGSFNEEQEIDFDEVTGTPTDFVFNHAIDFQAAVRDLAGNIGFSDSDAANPRFIDALGEEDALGENKAAKRTSEGKKHNVLGYFSAHIVYIDDMDPVIAKEMSVTGFYGLNSDDEPVRDRSAVMVVFDGGVNGDLIDTGTFTLEYDDESAIAIEDVVVDGKLVFLKLGEELASDARPTLSISEGREVEDMAGNVLSWQEKDAEAFKLEDGILPVLTLTLSGGSGTGIGREGPSKLTDGAIDIAIASDEDITGAPRVSVVCPNITWMEDDEDGDPKKRGLSDFVNNRTGYTDASTDEMGQSCGESAKTDSFIRSASLARPGNNWVYAWRNSNTEALKLNDGELVIVVWAQDRSEYDGHDSDICGNSKCKNYGSVTTRFVLDNTFNSPLNKDGSGGSVQPEADSEVKEPRPFVYLDFAGEATTVKVTEFTINGEDALSSLSTVGDNRFLYWPEALAFGTHTIEFDARDAADNEPTGSTSFDFDVTARDPFVIDLTAGWNAISLPANPVDTALDAVFTEEAVDRVVGWNPLSSTGPWSIATRIDGVWSTSANFAPLTDVVVRYGYWVHSMAFVKQSVDLKGQLDRETGDNPAPIGIITAPGWNFVGVIDQDGDQTENHFGKVLQDSEKTDVTADDYMPGFRQAYTWDAIANGYRVLSGDGNMIIGKGIWVFFPDDKTIAP